MTCDKIIRGKMTLKWKDDQKEGGRKALVDIELDQIAKIEIANFIDGFYAGKESVVCGTVYGSVEQKIADQIMNRYANDTTTDRRKVYELICEKLKDF